MNYSLIPNDPDVIRTIATWIYEEWLKPNPDASIEKIITLLSQRIDSTKVPLTIVAFEDDGTPVGTASLTELDMKSHPELTPWLGAVYVSNAARGRGIASELCKRIEKEAKSLGHSILYLFTKDQVSLYSNMEWKIKYTEEYRGMNVTVMEKELTI